MRVEREAEKSTCSLSEELNAVKEKHRNEKKTIAERMVSFCGCLLNVLIIIVVLVAGYVYFFEDMFFDIP